MPKSIFRSRSAIMCWSLPSTRFDGRQKPSDGQVVVVTPNHRVEFRKIELGMETADEVEVRSGLNEGDLS